jgi:C4-dicarboxylate-specific signal transduction histidine kinase
MAQANVEAAALGTLGASVAREINQPLAAIIAGGNASVRWLEREDLPRARASVARILSDADRASEIIRGIRHARRTHSSLRVDPKKGKQPPQLQRLSTVHGRARYGSHSAWGAR